MIVPFHLAPTRPRGFIWSGLVSLTDQGLEFEVSAIPVDPRKDPEPSTNLSYSMNELDAIGLRKRVFGGRVIEIDFTSIEAASRFPVGADGNRIFLYVARRDRSGAEVLVGEAEFRRIRTRSSDIISSDYDQT